MSRSRVFIKRALGLAVTAISLYLVMPSVISSFSSWPQLRELNDGSLAIMAVLMVVSLGCYWVLLGVCLRSRDWLLMGASQMSSSAIASILPGGAATATAFQYRMLNEAGLAKSDVATGLTVATLLNYAVLFALPVFAVPTILFGAPIDSVLLSGAVAAVICFVSAAIIGGLFLLWDRPLAKLGNLVDSILGRFRTPAPDTLPRAETFIRSRNLIRSHLAASWYWVALSSFGKWIFDFFALVMAVRGVGNDANPSLVLLAFVAATLLTRIPFTPGGVGFVEVGLTGMLTVVGLDAGDAVLATLAYRLVSYWLPIPLGAVLYAIQRRRLHKTGIELPGLSERDTTEPFPTVEGLNPA